MNRDPGGMSIHKNEQCSLRLLDWESPMIVKHKKKQKKTNKTVQIQAQDSQGLQNTKREKRK